MRRQQNICTILTPYLRNFHFHFHLTEQITEFLFTLSIHAGLMLSIFTQYLRLSLITLPGNTHSLQPFDTRRLKQIEHRGSYSVAVPVPVTVPFLFPFASALSNPLALSDRYLLRSRAHFKYLGSADKDAHTPRCQQGAIKPRPLSQ